MAGFYIEYVAQKFLHHSTETGSSVNTDNFTYKYTTSGQRLMPKKTENKYIV